MAFASINGIKIALGFDTRGLEKDVPRATAGVKSFANEAEEAGRRVDATANSLDRAKAGVHGMTSAMSGLVSVSKAFSAIPFVGGDARIAPGFEAATAGARELTRETEKTHSALNTAAAAAMAVASSVATPLGQVVLGVGVLAIKFAGLTAVVAKLGITAITSLSKGLVGAVAGLGSVALGVVGVVAGAAVMLATSVIAPALKASETLMKKATELRHAFGGSASIVRGGADAAAGDLGITRESFMGGAASLSKAGAGAQTASELTTAAAALAKFKGLDFEETLSAIKAGLGGTSDALKKFNIDLTGATTVQERATRIAEGLAKAQQGMTDIQQTAGQAAETTKARWHNLYASIGEAIQPAAAAFEQLWGEIPRRLEQAFEQIKEPVQKIATEIAYALNNIGLTWRALEAGVTNALAGMLGKLAEWAGAVDGLLGTHLADGLRSAQEAFKMASEDWQAAANATEVRSLTGRKAGEGVTGGGASSVATDEILGMIAPDPSKGAKALEDITARMKEQLATVGQGEGALELYRLKMAGATDAQIAGVKAMQDQVAALKAQEKARNDAADATKRHQESMQQEAKSIAESVMTPFERAQKEIARINDLAAQGLLSNETADRARKKALDGLKDSGPEGADQASKLAGALAAGSQEARTAVLASRGLNFGPGAVVGDAQKDIAQTNRTQVGLQEKMEEHLRNLPSQLGQAVASLVPETISI